MLHLALMSSENRAANALGRNYPGGLPAFVAAMNAKAQALGMTSTRFIEPTGLSSDNASSPHDLARLLRAASQRPLIHRYPPTPSTTSRSTTARRPSATPTCWCASPTGISRSPRPVSSTRPASAWSCWPASTARPGHRAAGLTGQALAHWRRGTHPPHRAERKSRWRRPSPAAEAGAIARQPGPIRWALFLCVGIRRPRVAGRAAAARHRAWRAGPPARPWR